MMRIEQANHGNIIVSHFDRLYREHKDTDVSLWAGGQILKAHKLVLASHSNVLRQIFEAHQDLNQYPVIVLKDIPFQDLKLIVDFIYSGSIRVSREYFCTSLVNSAQSLEVTTLVNAATNIIHGNQGGHEMELSATSPLEQADGGNDGLDGYGSESGRRRSRERNGGGSGFGDSDSLSIPHFSTNGSSLQGNSYSMSSMFYNSMGNQGGQGNNMMSSSRSSHGGPPSSSSSSVQSASGGGGGGSGGGGNGSGRGGSNNSDKLRLRCPVCQSHFSSRSSLHIHMKSVHFNHRYKCKFCMREFKWPSELYNHTKMVHKIKGYGKRGRPRKYPAEEGPPGMAPSLPAPPSDRMISIH